MRGKRLSKNRLATWLRQEIKKDEKKLKQKAKAKVMIKMIIRFVWLIRGMSVKIA